MRRRHTRRKRYRNRRGRFTSRRGRGIKSTLKKAAAAGVPLAAAAYGAKRYLPGATKKLGRYAMKQAVKGLKTYAHLKAPGYF